VHGDSVWEGGVAGVVIQVEAQVHRVTERQDGNAIVASVDVKRRRDITHEVQRRLEVVLSDRTRRVDREHDVWTSLTRCHHTHIRV